MRNFGLGMDSKEKRVKHRIGWCVNCGFVHENVRAYTMVEHGYIVIKPICETCRKKERERTRMVQCAVCGLVKGDNLFPTTIERSNFEEINTCNFIVPLCAECRKKPHSVIREQLNLQIKDICVSCPDRFKCYTSAHGKPTDSQVFSQDPLKFQRNPKAMTKRFYR